MLQKQSLNIFLPFCYSRRASVNNKDTFRALKERLHTLCKPGMNTPLVYLFWHTGILTASPKYMTLFLGRVKSNTSKANNI